MDALSVLFYVLAALSFLAGSVKFTRISLDLVALGLFFWVVPQMFNQITQCLWPEGAWYVSALSVLGLIGTALTAFFMIPHLTSAMRDGFPHGTTIAWVVMVIQAAVWAAYGIIDKDPLVTAPTLISGPIAVILAVWTYRYKKLARVE